MHKSQDLFMHTVKHSFSTKTASARLTFIASSALRCERFTVFTYFTEVRWEQLSKTTLSRVAFPRTGAEYSHDCFENRRPSLGSG